ncbi:MAG: hypothetical protein VR65_25020 [Desulfobulbaceae bacterium BRH_c16a]|nr:MAG: hypothetical protein VR65_25020 [Desulfobulbaceae bacterium BRH_c16a]
MIKEEKIVVRDKDIIVKELTLTAVDALFASFSIDRAPTLAERLIDSPIPVEVVTASTGLQDDELNAFTPSEIDEIWKATARVNDFLSVMVERTVKLLPDLSTDLTENGSGGSSAG